MRVLIVDDEANLRRMLRALLQEEGHQVEEVERGDRAVAVAEGFDPEVVLLDLALPGLSGLEVLPRLLEKDPGLPVIMMSGEASLGDAVEATRRGAFHFLEKPLTPEAVLVTLRGALEVARARDLSRALREELGPEARMVGESPAMEKLRRTIRKVAPTEARILITGESGTGKELAAAAIHGLSKRSGGPFVRVNSAAIPRELVESEMFGHERGAFTGATERRRGRFEMASGGTLFLDEVGDLGPEAQAKLLRTLETGTVQRVGGSQPVEVDVRVLAATNRDLRTLEEEGRFREDLLFRLEVLPLHLPPLRERPEDIPPLVAHALERLRSRHGLPAPELEPGAMELLQSLPWPGNVRELFNLVERIAILHPGARVGGDEVKALLPEARPGSRQVASDGPTPSFQDDDPRTLRQRLDDYEAELIRGALRASEGNVAEAARILQTDRGNLYRRMTRLDLSRPGESGETGSGQDAPQE